VRLTSDAAGQVGGARYHAFYPFGEELSETYLATQAERLRFTGHERDLGNSSGQSDDLDYMHARHYSPLLGRFLSVDVGDPRLDAPQSWNRFGYVMSNPISFVDPSGLEAVHRAPLPAGMTPDEVSTDVTAAWGITVCDGCERERWRFAPGPNTGLYGANSLLRGRSFLNSVRTHIEDRFEKAAVRGHYVAAAIDYLGLEIVIPEDETDAGMELGLAFLPGGKLSKEVLTSKSSRQLGGTLTRKLFGKGGTLNRGQNLRIGFGRRGGNRVFRIAGRWVQRVTGRSHIDLWTSGKL
jgi:RHS repeat-associated protein